MAVTLRQWRARVGMTQRELARRLGITDRQVRRLERGDTQPSEMLRLAMMALDAERNAQAARLRAQRKEGQA